MIGSIYATCLKSASDSDCIYSSHTNAREQEQIKGACTKFTCNSRVCKPRFSHHGYSPFETSYKFQLQTPDLSKDLPLLW